MVGQFLDWLRQQNADSADTEYWCTPDDAATLCEYIGGFRED